MALEAAGQSGCMTDKSQSECRAVSRELGPVFTALDNFAGFQFNLPKGGFAAVVRQNSVGTGPKAWP